MNTFDKDIKCGSQTYSGIPSQMLLLCDTMKISASLTISGLCHYRIGLNEEFVETAFKIEYFQEGVMKIKIERLMGDWKGRGEVACVEEVVGDTFEGGQVSSFGMEGLMGGGGMNGLIGGRMEERKTRRSRDVASYRLEDKLV